MYRHRATQMRSQVWPPEAAAGGGPGVEHRGSDEAAGAVQPRPETDASPRQNSGYRAGVYVDY